MTREQVASRVAEIAAAAGDDEAAHGMEDDLYTDLLAAIADGTCVDPAGCAAEALKANKRDFNRWSA